MGRKIPGKKHRGIKDPEKQRAKRWAELKTKINAPPGNIEDQTIPKSLARVMKLKDDVKSGKISAVTKNRKRKSNKGLISLGAENPTLHPNARPEKSVPVFNQRAGETSERFMQRVNRETQAFLNETTFEKKYNVEIKRNPVTGDVEGVNKAPKDEIDELMKMKMKHKNIGKKKKKKKDLEPKLTKVQKRKKKLDLKKEKKLQDNIDEFKEFRENIAFGDVAHAPPDLRLKPLKAKDGRQIGEKKLLLQSMFAENEETKVVRSKSATIDKTGKRKDLPSAERRLLEKQQSDVIAAYRLLKSQKSSNVNL